MAKTEAWARALAETINHYAQTIIDSVLFNTANEEALLTDTPVYLYYKVLENYRDFRKTGSSDKQDLFEFYFTKFFGLDTRKPLNKRAFFDELYKANHKTYKGVLGELYFISRREFVSYNTKVSFASKLIHIIDRTFPIFDSRIEFIFGKMNISTIGRICTYIHNLYEVYQYLIKNSLLRNGKDSALDLFDKHYGYLLNDLCLDESIVITEEKKIDFFLWAMTMTQLEVTYDNYPEAWTDILNLEIPYPKRYLDNPQKDIQLYIDSLVNRKYIKEYNEEIDFCFNRFV